MSKPLSNHFEFFSSHRLLGNRMTPSQIPDNEKQKIAVFSFFTAEGPHRASLVGKLRKL